MKTRFSQAMKTAVLFLIPAIMILSCNKEYSHGGHHGSEGQTGIRLFLTDDPSLAFDKLFIDIQKVEIKVQDSIEDRHDRDHELQSDDDDHHGNSSGGWMALVMHPGIYDILQFRNGLDTLFGTGNFSSLLAFRKIRITLGNNNSVVWNGQTFSLQLKDDDRFVVVKTDDFNIQFNSPDLFELWMDFDAGRSVRRHGNGFELRPEIRLFTRERAGGIEGRVSPAAAVVMAVNGTDTLTAKPEDEGEFKFIGLKAGTYSLLFHATANGYQDSLINNIGVGEREDTQVGTVVLHP